MPEFVYLGASLHEEASDMPAPIADGIVERGADRSVRCLHVGTALDQRAGHVDIVAARCPVQGRFGGRLVRVSGVRVRPSSGESTSAGTKTEGAHEQRGRVELTLQLEAAMVEAFLEAIAPLSDSGKMGALILQLSPSFSPRTHSLDELDHLFEMLSGYHLAVELRHREWFVGKQKEKTIEHFRKQGVALAVVDAPRRVHFMIVPRLDVVTDPKLVYLRAHGRNAKGYISGRTVAERFDYDYTDTELAEIAKRAAKLATLAAEAHVIFNNNKSSYAPSAAIRFRQIVEKRFAKKRPSKSSSG